MYHVRDKIDYKTKRVTARYQSYDSYQSYNSSLLTYINPPLTKSPVDKSPILISYMHIEICSYQECAWTRYLGREPALLTTAIITQDK